MLRLAPGPRNADRRGEPRELRCVAFARPASRRRHSVRRRFSFCFENPHLCRSNRRVPSLESVLIQFIATRRLPPSNRESAVPPLLYRMRNATAPRPMTATPPEHGTRVLSIAPTPPPQDCAQRAAAYFAPASRLPRNSRSTTAPCQLVFPVSADGGSTGASEAPSNILSSTDQSASASNSPCSSGCPARS